MAQTTNVAASFSLGAISDDPRDLLPKGASYRLFDYIPNLGSGLRKRGGWEYASKDLGSLAGAQKMSGVGWVPFPDDGMLVAVDEAGRAYAVRQFDGSAGTLIGTTHGQPLTHKPFWHRDRQIILPSLFGAAANPYKLTSSAPGTYALAVAGTTPPQARVGWSWGDYLVLANGTDPTDSSLHENRVWYSSAGLPDTWVLSGASAGYFDTRRAVVCGVALRNVQLIWGYQDTWLYTGDTPPPGGNLDENDLFPGIGCMDGRSLTTYRDYAIWANQSGVWKTDGATPTDLTEQGGYSNRYRELVSGFSAQDGWSATGEVYRSNYLLTIRNASGLVTTLVLDLERVAWYEFKNINASMLAARPASPGTALASGDEELFFSHATQPRAGMISPCWAPSSVNPLDGDGVAVEPEWDTAFYLLGTDGPKRIRRAYLEYDLDSDSGARLDVYASVDPADEDYTDIGLIGSVPAVSKQSRKAVGVNQRAYQIGFSVRQVGASNDTRIENLDLEGHLQEASR